MHPWIRRAGLIAVNLHRIPAIVRLSAELIAAQEDAARQDYQAAERRLARIYASNLPPRVLERTTADLLTALVSLRLGDPQAAADRAPTGVHHAGSLRIYANPVERDYLKYAGRLILEEATDLLGEPMTLDVGVDYDDLDIERVRPELRTAFPVYRSRYADAPPIH